MKLFTSLLAVGIAAICGANVSFGQTVTTTYQQTSVTGLTTSTATRPLELDDITLGNGGGANFSTTYPELSTITFGYGVLPSTTAQTGGVIIQFYGTVNSSSTGVVESNYLGGFQGTFSIAANTSTTTTVGRASTFSNLQTLSTPILFPTTSFGVVITLTNSAFTAYSTVVTPLTSNPGAPTIGSSTTGVYRDTSGDGDFQANEFQAGLGNAYLSIGTIVVPEPSTYALCALGLAGCAGVVLRRRMNA